MQFFEKKIKDILSTTFDIREGEFNRTFLLMLYIFLVISSNLILKPTVISLFLSEFGIQQLPIAFIFVAIFAAAIITFYTYSLTVTSIKTIIIRTFIFSNFSFLLFWVLLRINFLSGWVLYLFYIWVAVFSVLSASQFWIFANLIFNSREAKRLFGIIGAGAIGGGIFGGYLTSILAEVIGSENLILVSVFFLILCIPIVNNLWNNNINQDHSQLKQKKMTGFFENHPITLIKSSKYLTYLALIVGISVVVARLVEFQFSAVASREIIDEDELTSFFGFWFSNMNIISLIIQLFLTRRVVGVFGVGTSLFFLPAGIFIGTFAIFISPTIWAAILIRLSDGSLKQSINKSGMELLALPVPSEIKNQTKSYIDIFVDSIATGIGGLLLIVLSSGFDISIRYISFGTLLMLGIWFYLIFQVKREYINSFKQKLETNKNNLKDSVDISNESVLGGIIKLLNRGSEKQILSTLRTIRDIQNEALLPSLERLINHPSSNIQLEALRNLYFYKSHSFNNQVKELITDPNQEIREEAFYYLFEHDPQDSIELMNSYINNTDIKIANSALISLAAEIKDNVTLREKFNLEKIIQNKLDQISKCENPDELEEHKITVLRIISITNLSNFYSEFNKFLDDESPNVVNAAIYSIKNIQLLEYIPILLNKLGDTLYSKATIETLQNFGYTVLDDLEEYMKLNSDIGITKKIIEILGGIGSNRSVKLLLSEWDNNFTNLKTEILEALNRLKIKYPFLNFEEKKTQYLIKTEVKISLELLSGLFIQYQIEAENETNIKDVALTQARKNFTKVLVGSLDTSIKRIFLLLGIIYNPEDINKIFRSIQSADEDLKENAIDYLDNLLEINLKKIVLPIVEARIYNKYNLETLKRNNIKVPHEPDVYKNLLISNEPKLILSLIKVIYLARLNTLYSNIENLKLKSSKNFGSAIDKIKSELNFN